MKKMIALLLAMAMVLSLVACGKAKKNDPPIPADLAPISGAGHKPRKTEEKTESAFLEPVKFRYSTESLVEEQPIAAPAPAAEENREEHRQRRNKPGRSRKPRAEALPEQPAQEPAPKAEKQEKPQRPPRKPRPERKGDAAPKAEEPKAEKPEQLKTEDAQEKVRRRKPYYHNRRRKPRENGGAPAGE